MKIGTVTKQPVERFSYTVDYSEALTDGDNIESVTARSIPDGLMLENVGANDPLIRFWASGGASGATYKVELTVSTADGRIFQDELIFKIKEV